MHPLHPPKLLTPALPTEEVTELGMSHIASGSHFLACLTEIFRCFPVCTHSSTKVHLLGSEITLYQGGYPFMVNLSLT